MGRDRRSQDCHGGSLLRGQRHGHRVNGSSNGKKVTLALTDPDSNGVVPSTSPQFGGDFVLNSQGDEQLIFSGASGQNLQVLKISNSVDDIARATSATGTLYTSDATSNTIDAITGTFTPDAQGHDLRPVGGLGPAASGWPAIS